MKTHFYLCILMFVFSLSNVRAQKSERPVAVNDTITMITYGSVLVDVMANDYDPNDLEFFISEVDDSDYFNLEIVDGQVLVTSTQYFIGKKHVDYEIENSDGKDDGADIVIYVERNPDVPFPTPDYIHMDSQTEFSMDLLANDEYSGTEELKIISVSNPENHEIELLDDGRTIKFKAGCEANLVSFQYEVQEQGGNEYIANGGGSVYIYLNAEQPIVNTDTAYTGKNTPVFIDVLDNDLPQGSVAVLSVNSEYTEIVGDQIKFTPYPDYIGLYLFKYDIKDINNQFISTKNQVVVDIGIDPESPIAVNDTLTFPFSDTIFISPLMNDINPKGNPLALSNACDSLIPFVQHRLLGSGHYQKVYSCQDLVTGETSNQGQIFLQVLPPDSIVLDNLEYDYTIGETLNIDLNEHTNIISNLSGANCNWGTTNIEDGMLSYSLQEFDNHAAIDFFYSHSGKLNDEIKVYYSFEDQLPMRHIQSIKINILQPDLVNYLEVNNFRNRVTPYGILSSVSSWNEDENIKGIEYPKNSRVNNLSMINPWLANKDENGNIIVVGEQYEGIGYEFFYGPLADNYSGDYMKKYFRTWKVTKAEIERHKVELGKSEYEIPEAIQNWPAGLVDYNGYQYEQADFVDLNENDIYEPEQGDYPKISGDLAVLYVVNNGRYPQGNFHNMPTSDSLNVDMFVMVYAFDRPESEVFQNTFFMKYKIINKSDKSYDDFRFGQWVRAHELNSRYVGADSTQNTFYFYPPSYGFYNYPTYLDITFNHMECVSFLNQKMDKFTQPVSHDPYSSYIEKYHFMNGTWDDELEWQAPDWEDRAPLNYCYPSNPADPFGWSQLTDDYYYSKENEKGDAANRAIGTSGPHELNVGEKIEFELAFYINSVQQSGYFDLFDESLENIGKLIECYEKDSIPGGGSFTGINEKLDFDEAAIQIYPNPAHTILNIQTDLNQFKSYRIYSLHGQLIEESSFETQISIQHLPRGFYFLSLLSKNGKMIVTKTFVKE